LAYSNWLNNNDLNHLKNCTCYTGITRLSIDTNLDVYNAMCKTKKLGNLATGWNLLPEAITCPHERCTANTDDLMTRRYKNIKDE